LLGLRSESKGEEDRFAKRSLDRGAQDLGVEQLVIGRLLLVVVGLGFNFGFGFRLSGCSFLRLGFGQGGEGIEALQQILLRLLVQPFAHPGDRSRQSNQGGDEGISLSLLDGGEGFIEFRSLHILGPVRVPPLSGQLDLGHDI
jgi:hypothetical protein